MRLQLLGVWEGAPGPPSAPAFPPQHLQEPAAWGVMTPTVGKSSLWSGPLLRSSFGGEAASITVFISEPRSDGELRTGACPHVLPAWWRSHGGVGAEEAEPEAGKGPLACCCCWL